MSDQPPPGNYPPPGGNYPPPGQNPPPGGNYPPPGQPYGYGGPPQAPQNGAGIIALVLAILALLTSWTIIGGIILGLLAIVFGFVGRSKYKKSKATNGTVSLIAIVLGFIAAILSIVLVVVGVGIFANSGGTDFIDCMSNAGNNQREQQRCADEFQSTIEDKYSVTLQTTP